MHRLLVKQIAAARSVADIRRILQMDPAWGDFTIYGSGHGEPDEIQLAEESAHCAFLSLRPCLWRRRGMSRSDTAIVTRGFMAWWEARHGGVEGLLEDTVTYLEKLSFEEDASTQEDNYMRAILVANWVHTALFFLQPGITPVLRRMYLVDGRMASISGRFREFRQRVRGTPSDQLNIGLRLAKHAPFAAWYTMFEYKGGDIA